MREFGVGARNDFVLLLLFRLLSFSEKCDSTHKADISLVLYPIFVHVYLDLVAGGHSELGKNNFLLSSLKARMVFLPFSG